MGLLGSRLFVDLHEFVTLFNEHRHLLIGFLLGNTHSNKLTACRIKLRVKPVVGGVRFAKPGVEVGIVAPQMFDLFRLPLVLLSIDVQFARELNYLLFQIMNRL